MQYFRPAMRDELLKYQKRKRKSLDGRVPGVPPFRYRRGLRYAVGPLPGNYGSTYSSVAPGFYTASGVQYTLPATHYRSPTPWFVGMPQRTTPPLRVAPGPGSFARTSMPHVAGPDEVAENPLEAEVTVLFQEPEQTLGRAESPRHLRHMLGDLLLLGAEEPGRPFRFTSDAGPDQSAVGASSPLADHPWQGPAEMTQEMFDQAMAAQAEQGMEPEPMVAQPDPFEQGAPGFADQGLEALVAQDSFAAQAAPEAMYDPMMPDPYAAQREMYDDQMQQLMDPWMMPGPLGPMGPGFGPMGPMPGP